MILTNAPEKKSVEKSFPWKKNPWKIFERDHFQKVFHGFFLGSGTSNFFSVELFEKRDHFQLIFLGLCIWKGPLSEGNTLGTPRRPPLGRISWEGLPGRRDPLGKGVETLEI